MPGTKAFYLFQCVRKPLSALIVNKLTEGLRAADCLSEPSMSDNDSPGPAAKKMAKEVVEAKASSQGTDVNEAHLAVC